MLTMLDAAEPANLPNSGIDAIAGYLLFPRVTHAWEPSDWLRFGRIGKLPIAMFNPGHNPGADAVEAIRQVQLLGQPVGTAIALDIEADTAWASPVYSPTWASVITQAGYVPVGYTSGAYAGYLDPFPIKWVADYIYKPFLFAGSQITQWTNGDNYDTNVVLESVPLWGLTNPVRPPAPLPPYVTNYRKVNDMHVFQYVGQEQCWYVDAQGRLIQRFTTGNGIWQGIVHGNGLDQHVGCDIDTTYNGQLHIYAAFENGSMLHRWYTPGNPWQEEIVSVP